MVYKVITEFFLFIINEFQIHRTQMTTVFHNGHTQVLEIIFLLDKLKLKCFLICSRMLVYYLNSCITFGEGDEKNTPSYANWREL